MKLWMMTACCLCLSGCALVTEQAAQKSYSGKWQEIRIDGEQVLRGAALSVLGDRSLAMIGQGSEASFILKRDPVGTIQWYKQADTPLSNLYASHYSRAGALIAAGDYPSVDSGVQQAYALSLSPNGNIHWQSQFHSTDDMAILAIDETPDGDLLFAGALYPAASNAEFDAMADSFILKANAEGRVVWQRPIHLLEDDQAEDILVLPDGRILALINNRDQNEASLGVHLVLLDSAGEVLHNRRLPAEGFANAAAMALSIDGQSIWIVGTRASSVSEQGQDHIALLKVNSEAEVQEYFIDHDSVDAAPGGIAVLADGSVLVAGTGQPENTLGDLNVLYLRFAPDGTVIERADFGGSGIDFAEAIQVLNDGSIQILATYNALEEPELRLISRSGF